MSFHVYPVNASLAALNEYDSEVVVLATAGGGTDAAYTSAIQSVANDRPGLVACALSETELGNTFELAKL
jgi:hypothetical protein